VQPGEETFDLAEAAAAPMAAIISMRTASSALRVLRPLEIVEHFGSAAMLQLAGEIMALTKMDWNSAMFAGKEPITTAFSEDVGHILAELPPGVEPRPQYRFYM
jgi:hypothetical protein